MATANAEWLRGDSCGREISHQRRKVEVDGKYIGYKEPSHWVECIANCRPVRRSHCSPPRDHAIHNIKDLMSCKVAPPLSLPVHVHLGAGPHGQGRLGGQTQLRGHGGGTEIHTLHNTTRCGTLACVRECEMKQYIHDMIKKTYILNRKNLPLTS